MKSIYRPKSFVVFSGAIILLPVLTAHAHAQVSFPPPLPPAAAQSSGKSAAQPPTPSTPSTQPVVYAARMQIGVTTSYDPAYRTLTYPNGDVPTDRGVCTDVVIRALRTGAAVDLQQVVHEDMKANFAVYPKQWGLKKPDKNIDHRRVPNLQTFFTRRGWNLPVTDQPKDYLPGDLVTCMVGGKLPHIMIVSTMKTASGRPLVIHNIGDGTQEEDRLFDFKLTGHYRLPATEKPASR